jgi:hypothetical protein
VVQVELQVVAQDPKFGVGRRASERQFEPEAQPGVLRRKR